MNKTTILSLQPTALPYNSDPPLSRPINSKGVRVGGIGRDRCHLLVNFNPASQYHLPPRGGSTKTTHLSKTTLPKTQNRSFFFLFNTLSLEADSGKTEIDFQKPREVFVQNGMKKKTSSIVFIGSTSWENRSHLLVSFF